MPTAVAALFVAGLFGLACSSSGLKSRAGDAGAASGRQAGSTITSGTTGGSGGAIGPGGSAGASVGGTGGSLIGPGGAGGVSTGGTGGAASVAGAGGTIGSGGISGADAGGRTSASDAGRPNGDSGTGSQGHATDSPLSQGGMCGAIPGCNPGDQQVGFTSGSEYADLSGDCPAERECYSLGDNCGSILCVVPEGVHCDDPLSCNPGDTPTASNDPCVGRPSPCYQNKLCAQSIMCRYGADAGVDASGKPEPDSSSQRVGAPHPQPCLAGEFLYEGELCPYGGSGCSPEGDGWCYTQCQQGGTCAGGFICGEINFFNGGDIGEFVYFCNGPIGSPVGGACRRYSNDCNARAACVPSTACGDASVCTSFVCQN